VELSDHARFLDELRRLPDVRSDRVEEVRQAIAEGAYETDGRLERAIDRLIQDFLGE
jgi:negative regulator of flagellin synthesis FlgM